MASFTYAPAQPLTGQAVTFTSTSTEATTIAWDLNGDAACDDGTGPVVTRAFPIAGSYDVRICVNGIDAIQRQTITVRNRPPTASFTVVPANPVAKEPVTLTSTALDADGPIVAQAWDLDADGSFDDAQGEIALYAWPKPGSYPVGLRVVDRDGAPALALALIKVAPRPLKLLGSAPLVRVSGQPRPGGVHLDLLAVTAPKGARVGIRCRGANCPYKLKRFTSKGKRVVLRALRRNFAAGNVIEIRVTKPETLGRFTRLRVRAGERPARLDRCIEPGRPNKPLRCPDS